MPAHQLVRSIIFRDAGSHDPLALTIVQGQLQKLFRSFDRLTGYDFRHPQLNLGEIIDADHSYALDRLLPLRRLRLFLSRLLNQDLIQLGNFLGYVDPRKQGFALADDSVSGKQAPLIGAVPIADVSAGADLSLNFRRCFRHEGSDQNRDDPQALAQVVQHRR